LALRLSRSVLVATLQCVAMVAFGQESLGDVLDKSGKLLTGDELKAELAGHWISWKSPNGMLEFQVRPDDGGTRQGQVKAMRGACTDFSGTWKIKDSGQFCMAASYRCGSSNLEFEGCPYWFKAGDQYWASASNNDRSTKVLARSVSKQRGSAI
jgi:hypothetical protein